MKKNIKKNIKNYYIWYIVFFILIIAVIVTILEVFGVTHIIDGFTISKKVPRKIVISKNKHLIPRNIYRIMIDSDTFHKDVTRKTKEVPEKYKKAYDFTQKCNPNYTQIVYDDNDIDAFLKKYYYNHPIWKNDVYKYYYKINPKLGAAKADFFRYVLLYEKGGIYLDMKSAVRNLDLFMKENDTFVYSYDHFLPKIIYKTLKLFQGNKYEIPDKILEQWWLATAPKNPIFKNIIDDMLQKLEQYEKMDTDTYQSCKKNIVPILHAGNVTLDILNVTGPILFTNAVERSIFKYKSRELLKDNSKYFIYDFNGDHNPGLSYRKKCESLIV